MLWAESQSSGHCLMHIHPCVQSSYKQTVRSECALHRLGLNVFPGCFQMLCLRACSPFLSRKSGIMGGPEGWGVVHCRSLGAQWFSLVCWLQAALPACPDCSPWLEGAQLPPAAAAKPLVFVLVSLSLLLISSLHQLINLEQRWCLGSTEIFPGNVWLCNLKQGDFIWA